MKKMIFQNPKSLKSKNNSIFLRFGKNYEFVKKFIKVKVKTFYKKNKNK